MKRGLEKNSFVQIHQKASQVNTKNEELLFMRYEVNWASYYFIFILSIVYWPKFNNTYYQIEWSVKTEIPKFNQTLKFWSALFK